MSPARQRRASGGTSAGGDSERAGVPLTHLDEELFDGANATKRDLIDYLEALSGPILAALKDRPLSVIRVLRGREAFMQKNVPRYTPDFVPTVTMWAESSRREVTYALCNDLPTLVWFGNQRAVEFHPTLSRTARPDSPDFLVLDIDPPSDADFGAVVAAAELVREALEGAGLAGAVKTSGAKGVHVFVPLAASVSAADAAAATRAIAARAEQLDPGLATTALRRADRGGRVFIDSTRALGATVVAAYSPRARPGAPVSFPVAWDELASIRPADFTLATAPELLAGSDPWAEAMPRRQRLPAALVAEGGAIPAARTAALQEGRRRARARRG